jgi:hypothetical protein
MGAVVFALLLTQVGLLSSLERRAFGTWLTPFTFLAVPYTAVVLLALTLGPLVGFIELEPVSILWWMAGLLVFWLGGAGVTLIIGPRIRRAVATETVGFEFESGARVLALVLAGISIPVIAAHLNSSIARVGGAIGVGTEEFEVIYGSGLGAHLLALGTVLVILLLGVAHKKDKVLLLTASTLLLLIFARQVKYAVILPMMAVSLYRVTSNRMQLRLRAVLGVVFGAFALFFAVYLFGFWALDSTTLMQGSTYLFLVRHFLAYLLGGVLVFGHLIQAGVGTVVGDPAITFSPFVNLLAAATSGTLVGSGNEYAAVISTAGGAPANVSTLFGPLLIGLGYFGAAAYTLSLGLVSYCIFAACHLSRNCWLLVLWTFHASFLGLSWFGNYFELLIAIEAPAYAAALAVYAWLSRAHRPEAPAVARAVTDL